MNANNSQGKGVGIKIISTWLYLEAPKEGGIYAQVPGLSHANRFFDVYRRCLLVFFVSARNANPDAELFLFSNRDITLSESKVNTALMETLKSLNVKCIVLEYSFRPPEEQKEWRNQFFVLDVIHYFASFVSDDDLCLVLDSDIVWSGSNSTKIFWDELSNQESLTMTPIKDTNEKINGTTINELKTISATLFGCIESKVDYAGGEFIGLKGNILKKIATVIEVNWCSYLKYLERGNIIHLEEAHFLSIIYGQLDIKFGSGNPYVRRIWTNRFQYSNRENNDFALVCWHIPAEKRFGIHRLSKLIMNQPTFYWPTYGSAEWKKIAKSLGVLSFSTKKDILDVFKSIKDKMFLIVEKMRRISSKSNLE